MRIDRILLPTDFSTCATHALNQAIYLARQFDAELFLLHVVALDQPLSTDPEASFPGGGEYLDRLTEVAKTSLTRLRGGKSWADLRVCELVRRGLSAGPVIARTAEEIDADLMVMGTHGRRAPAKWFLGSVAQEMVRYSPCPVVTLRADGADALSTTGPIVVPVDFSDISERAVLEAKELAAMWDTSVDLLHVIEIDSLPAFYGPAATVDTTPRLIERSLASLEELATETGGPDVEWRTAAVPGRPAKVIADLAEEKNARMIVMPTHGHGGLRRTLIGSTTEEVVRRATCPVLTLPPRSESAEAGQEEDQVGAA